MNFVNAVFNKSVVNEKGAISYRTTTNYRVDLFFKTCRQFNDMTLVSNSLVENKLDTMKIIFQARDSRGGKGERKLFRDILLYLINNGYSDMVEKNLENISYYGRWDDLVVLCNTKLQTKVFEIIKKQLLEDYDNMVEGKPITLLAKWLPSEGKKLDKEYKFVNRFCLYMEWKPKRYRHYLTTLREYLDIVEIKMTQKRWKEIDYSKVPSVAINKLKKAFERNDEERYKEWKHKLSEGKVKVNSSQVFPHELVRQYMRSGYEDEVIEQQWKNICEETKKLGIIENTIVLSDVSGSMNGEPMEVSIALGILISSLTKAPYKDFIITFHENPTFHHVVGNSLKEKVKNIRGMSWGGTTNFNRVFDIILLRAIANKLSKEDMPKRLIVISDMQFDQAGGNNMKTNYEIIQEKYQQHGYDMPEILFWNVRGNTNDFPATDVPGVGLVSGFSPSVLKAVLNGDGFTPYDILRKTIDDTRYEKIVV